MRDKIKHYPVNWVDGMKINKNHFIAQDDATHAALHDVASLNISPIRYGILPASVAGEDSFNVQITTDNQQTIRATVLFCQAITSGGVRISLPIAGQIDNEGVPTITFPFSASDGATTWWVILSVNPFLPQPTGSPNTEETPARFPFVMPTYKVEVISESQYAQYATNPYTIIIGKIAVNGNDIRVDENYIPPCFTVSAHSDLMSLHAELDNYLSNLEARCTQIVQKIFKKSQQNDLSELVLFLCDRVMLSLGQSITHYRWAAIHEGPAGLFEGIVSLARVMKNTIDLRIGSGKEELMNYLSEWCELKQGELESLLSNIAAFRYDHNDTNKNIQKVVTFVKITGKLFDTLSNLDFIGKRRETGIFVKEEHNDTANTDNQPKARRRFFGS